MKNKKNIEAMTNSNDILKKGKEEIIDIFKKNGINEDDLIFEMGQSYPYNIFKGLLRYAQQRKPKRFHVQEIEDIDSNISEKYHFNIDLNRKKDEINIKDKLGMYKVVFSDGSFLISFKFFNTMGDNVVGIQVATQETWKKFIKEINRKNKRNSRPKNSGVHQVFCGEEKGLFYKKMNKIQETPVIHPSVDDLLKDMEFFFDNTELFTKYNQPGIRKVLLQGEPGTGKSSVCYRIAQKYNKRFPIYFSNDITSSVKHLQLHANHDRPNILFIEDCDSVIGGSADSGVLNFLDGVSQPINKNGSYVILTTNFPQNIENRIKKRPGRIDKIIKFDNLYDGWALECAKFYFEDTLFSKKLSKKKRQKLEEDLTTIVNGKTGAQIRELFYSSLSYAVSQGKNINIEIIRETEQQLMEALKDTDDSEQDSLNRKPKKVGYETVSLMGIPMQEEKWPERY